MNTLYLHLGLHKTGTTTLQNQVFPLIEDLTYLQRDLSDRNSLYFKILQYCVLKKENLGVLSGIRESLALLLQQGDVLLSEEWFTSDYSPFNRFEGAPWQTRLARLSQIVDGCSVKIILTIRHPETALFSYYCEMCQLGALKRWPTFLDFVEQANDAKCYDVCVLTDFICQRFSVSAVDYVKFEVISESSGEFLRDIFVFLNRENRSKITLNRSNVKQKTEGGVMIKELTFGEHIMRKCAFIIPRALKVSLLRQWWGDLRYILKRKRKHSEIVCPDEVALRQIRLKYKTTVQRFYSE